jgi:hypothetical protein
MSNNELAVKHLLLKLRPINRALRSAVNRLAAKATRLDRPDLKSLCITDAHVATLLMDVDDFVQCSTLADEAPFSLTAEEVQFELQLREQATDCKLSLPLDVLRDSSRLTVFDIDSLLICAASELHPAYERICGYILDDLNRRFPCVELLCNINSVTEVERLQRRTELGPTGRLRKSGLLESFGETTTSVRTQLRLTTGVLEFLLGSSPSAVGIWRDADEIDTDESSYLDKVKDPRIQRIGAALTDTTVDIVGLWGADNAGVNETARMIARSAGKSLRRLCVSADANPSSQLLIRYALQTAAARDAILLIETDSLREVEYRLSAEALIRDLVSCDVPTFFAGSMPWRPTVLLANRTYVELPVTSANHATREQIWRCSIPEMDRERASELTSRYRLSSEEIQAVGRMARAQAVVESNGKPATVESQLDMACAAVAQKSRGRFLGVVKPKRGPSDLILPPDMHRQVLEIAGFARAMPLVAETWGFGRQATGGIGMKCLFTGDPGTGKTLAAEVIASEMRTPLLKVNIAEVVSKWVGETEKNLDGAFNEALSSHAVLFFDEADALFGKRGEVRHGVDRYANLEVSHLLQRLEEHDGLVILASNLKDNIDSAFIRRFQIVLHFPRPQEAERRRLWEIAFPKQAPLDRQVNVSSLSRLDMTGAGIVGAARTAALLAAKEGAAKIEMSHVVRGIARQFRREARILSASELGQYASLLQDQP